MPVGAKGASPDRVPFGEDLDLARAIVPRVVSLRENAAVLTVDLETLMPVHAHGHRQVQVPQRAVGEAGLDEPAIGAEPLGQPRTYLGDLAAQKARGVD